MKLLLALTVVFALGALASAHPTYYKLAENVTCESPPPIASTAPCREAVLQDLVSFSRWDQLSCCSCFLFFLSSLVSIWYKG